VEKEIHYAKLPELAINPIYLFESIPRSILLTLLLVEKIKKVYKHSYLQAISTVSISTER